jgi:hypothetical protein
MKRNGPTVKGKKEKKEVGGMMAKRGCERSRKGNINYGQ